VRKALVAGAVAIFIVAAEVIPASGALAPPTPADNTTIQGTQTLFENGADSGGALFGVCNGQTTIKVTGPAGVTGLPNITVNGSGGAAGPSATTTWVTDNFPNGAYVITGTGKKYTSICLSSTTKTTTSHVTVHNVATLSYGGATEAPTGTSVTVKATLLDQNNVAPATGTVVTFALPGGNTVTATTNSSGVAQTTLAVTGAPRTVNLAVSAPATFFTAASTSVPFEVTADPTTTTVTASTNPTTYGTAVSFSAAVATSISGVGTPTGTVQFTVDGDDLGPPVTLDGAGHATSPSTTQDAGTHAIAAVYSPTGNFAGSTGTLSQTVHQASTTTGVTSSVNPTVFGQPVHFTAHVSTSASGAGTPVGNVVFQQNGQPIGSPVALDGAGDATSDDIAILTAPSSPYTVTATFQGSTNFSGSSTTLSQTVNKANTSIVVSSSASPSVSGQSVGFTSTVSAVAPGAGTPTGTVTYSVDGNGLGSGVTLSASGQGTSDGIADLLPGDHTVTVTYSGDGNFNGSSTTFNQHVDQAQTATSLSSSSNPSAFGQGVTYSAQVAVVAPGAGTPTGTVTFTADGDAIGAPVAVDASGNATSDPIASLTVGDHDIVATYSGDVRFEGSGDELTQTVNKAATTTSVDTSVSPSVFGQDVTFTATLGVVSPGAGTPTGTVEFFDGSTSLGVVPVTPAAGAGSAQVTTAGLSVGSHAISAVYSGDGSFSGSTGNTSQDVNKASSTTTLTQNGPIVQGQPVTFTASVAFQEPGAGTPTGTVQFKLNGAAQGAPVALDGSGSATSAPIDGLTPGGYTITAVYSGDGNLLPSTGHIGQAVEPATTSITLQSSGNPSAYGTPVTLLATVDIQDGAVGTPTGTVDFFDGPVLLGAGDLVDNGGGPQASITVPAFAVGHHALTAEYLGEADFQGSTSNTVDQVVNGVPTTVAVVSLGNPTVYHSPVTFRATVTPQVSNPNAVTGLVTFYDGTTALGSVPVTAASGTGTASITTSDLPAGSHSITATYSGDANFGNGTSSAITQTVTKQATSLLTSKTGSQVITATLTGAIDGPLAGRTVVIGAGSTPICTATTNAAGQVTCNGASASLAITLNGYQVTYAGDANYQGSSFNSHHG
jgi:hypothetical protein